jgi:hypothetical protein
VQNLAASNSGLELQKQRDIHYQGGLERSKVGGDNVCMYFHRSKAGSKSTQGQQNEP